MIKVGRFITYFSGEYGGPVNHILELTKHLEKYPIKTTIYASSDIDYSGKKRTFGYQKISPNFIIKRFNSYLKFKSYRISFGLINSLLKDIKDIDILHSHSFRTYQEDIASLMGKLKKKKLVITPHGALCTNFTYFEYLYKKVYDSFLTSIKNRFLNINYIAVSKLEKKFLLDFGIDKNFIHYIPHGINTSHFVKHNPYHLLKKYDLVNKKVILYVGRIAKRKGIEILIKSFSLLSQQLSDARLVIVGPDYDYKNELIKLIKKYNIENKIKFLGFIPKKNMPFIYSMADVVVYPSKYEIFGHVILEANACERVVIASDHWGPKELIINGKNGLLTKYGDYYDLNVKIRKILEDDDLKRKMGEFARKYVKENYSWELCAKNHYNLYKNLLSKSSE